jgi:hypothetical protein
MLEPYVQAGTKFFVAKVDVARVSFVNGQAKLSPLRFHYDSQEFNLPVRLGLLNSAGTQDLLVHILAPGQRYEVANYENVTIPTNIEVADQIRQSFGPFYAALLDRTLEKNPRAVITEYSWDANTCDPCPVPALEPEELMTLGQDVLGQGDRGYFGGMVLTRLHARYTKESLGEDLVFRTAQPIVGGREFLIGDHVERSSRPDSVNNFQGRYIIRHKWEGPIACENPIRGGWGGPPGGQPPRASAATDTAFVDRNAISLGQVIREAIPELELVPGQATPPAAPEATAAGTPAARPVPAEGGCASCTVPRASLGLGSFAAAAIVIAFLVRITRRRRNRERRKGEY